MKIIADAHIPFVKNYFSHAGELILKPGRSIVHDDVKDADLLLVRSITPVNKALLDKSKVKFVGSITAGADHLDTHYLDEAGIAWSVAAGFNALPVADYVVSVMASLQARAIIASKKRLKAAVIGMGNVGRLVADRLTKLNMEVVVCDPIRAQNETDFISTPLSELNNLDLISIHVPLTRTGSHPTHHMINQTFLKNQKANSVFLNASRGAVVDESDLKQFGSHLIWCLDVWKHEPHIDKTMLESACIATPHIAGYSIQSKYRGIEMIYQSAVEKKCIPPAPPASLSVPHQTISFSNQSVSWQTVVLKVFDPFLLTQTLKNQDSDFDALRNAFNSRHEFAFTTLVEVNLDLPDRILLQGLGFHLGE